MSFDFKEILTTFMVLFAVIDIVGNIPIIIDLRNNGGGYPQMVQLLASYFFDNEAVLLNTVYKRKENMTNSIRLYLNSENVLLKLGSFLCQA